MKSIKIKELREKTDTELQQLLSDLRGTLRDLRFRIAARQKVGARSIRSTKRVVARILTLQQERSAKNTVTTSA